MSGNIIYFHKDKHLGILYLHYVSKSLSLKNNYQGLSGMVSFQARMVFISVMPRVLHGSKGSVGDEGSDSSLLFSFDSAWIVSFGDILKQKKTKKGFQLRA